MFFVSRMSRGSIAASLIGLGVLVSSPSAQEAGLTGQDKAADVVQARQLLMDAAEEHMMVIDAVNAGKDLPLSDMKSRAYQLNILLLAFPHLFPPQTRAAAGEKDGSFQTNATDVLWKDFSAFYQAAQEFAATALDASQAADLQSFRTFGAKLRAGCDSCHKAYMTPVEPPR